MTLCNIQTSPCDHLTVVFILRFLCNCGGPWQFWSSDKMSGLVQVSFEAVNILTESFCGVSLCFRQFKP